MTCNGNVFRSYTYDTSAETLNIPLPDGYSYDIINIVFVNNISEINNGSIPTLGIHRFPPVNSKSPSTLTIHVKDSTKSCEIRFEIMQFGQIPDAHYFDKAFEPILVTGEDGNEYNVIPSLQFK